MLIHKADSQVAEVAVQHFARGPLRPARLATVRQRSGRRLGAHAFRVVDVFSVAMVTVIVIGASTGRPILEWRVADMLPVTFGALLLVQVLRWLELYRFSRSDRISHHLARVVLGSAFGLAIALLVRTVAGMSVPSSAWIVAWAGSCALGLIALHMTWWIFVWRWRSHGWLTPNIVIVGATSHAEDLIQEAIEHRDMNVLGIFDDRLERSPLALLGVPVLGNTEMLLTHKITPSVDLIVVAVDPMAADRVRQISARLAVLPNQVTYLFDQHNPTDRTEAIARLAESPLASLDGPISDDRRAFAKRIQDLVIGGLALVFAAPLMLLVSLFIRIDSRGPVLFRQRRYGFNNEEIVVWKFRTMRQEAADARAERQVCAGDPRVTRVGRILRKTSLDELPQLFNVIRGEMSLVGPRPHAIGMKTGDVESEKLVADYAHRHRIKPGMTGWAAVNGSRGPLQSPTDVSKRVTLDVEYIDRQTLWLDLTIMLRTVPSILGDRKSVR